MSMDTLTAEQKLFLEESEREFCDRFTDSDLEYKSVEEAGIPQPPIMFPWYPKSTQRYRGGSGNRYSNNRYDRRRGPYYRPEDRRYR